MTAATESSARGAVDRPNRLSWLRWGAVVFVIVETIHLTGGLLVNEWEGWGTFLGNLSFIVVSGLLVTSLAYGTLIRWGLKSMEGTRNRPALASLIAGLISVALYVVYWTWAPVLVAPGAVLLGREGLALANEGRGGRGVAFAGLSLGLLALAIQLFFMAYGAFHQGEYPFGL